MEYMKVKHSQKRGVRDREKEKVKYNLDREESRDTTQRREGDVVQFMSVMASNNQS